MTSKSFFLVIFIISVSICTLFLFFPKETNILLLNLGVNDKANYVFISLLSLITSLLSYIVWIVSFYLSIKREKIRLKRVARERENLNQIHQELQALMHQS